MDLILWRHADAEDGQDDAARRLTSKGRKQAQRMAEWLDKRLAKSARVLVSPAARAQETAESLDRSKKTDAEVNTGTSPAGVLKAAGWPDGQGTVVVVGHQPTLGAAAALALTGKASTWRMKKGAIWWLTIEEGEDPAIVAVITPEMV